MYTGVRVLPQRLIQHLFKIVLVIAETGEIEQAVPLLERITFGENNIVYLRKFLLFLFQGIVSQKKQQGINIGGIFLNQFLIRFRQT